MPNELPFGRRGHSEVLEQEQGHFFLLWFSKIVKSSGSGVHGPVQLIINSACMSPGHNSIISLRLQLSGCQSLSSGFHTSVSSQSSDLSREAWPESVFLPVLGTEPQPLLLTKQGRGSPLPPCLCTTKATGQPVRAMGDSGWRRAWGIIVSLLPG